MEHNLKTLTSKFGDEDKAREFIESLRWPDGPYCPHCGSTKGYRLTPKPTSKKPGRKGLVKCGDCKKQYTVTVGTAFEASHVPLSKWVIAIHLLCASKKGMSAHQLHRMLGLQYRTAWFLAHRIRFGMTQSALAGKLTGVIEADEVYIGPRRPRRGNTARGRGTNKLPVFALVQRGGDVRTFPIERMTAQKLQLHIRENVEPEAHVMTDEFGLYKGLKRDFAGHHTVTHSKEEYARKDGDLLVSTNTIEGFFGILKRGLSGVYQHVSKQHLPRYLSEFEFRYNSRKEQDGDRMMKAISGMEGKRLMYRDSCSLVGQ